MMRQISKVFEEKNKKQWNKNQRQFLAGGIKEK